MYRRLAAPLRALLVGALCASLSVAILGAGGCREETPAMKKANLGRALTERGALDKAIATLNEAVRLDPELVMSYELLGQAYEAAGRHAEAIGAYRETVRRDPVRDTAYVSLGCLLLSTGGGTDEAEAALARAIEINQTNAGAHACLGAAYLDRRDFARAIASSETAVSFNPQSVQAHLNLGIAYTETGQYDRARAEVEKVIQFAAGNEAVIGQARMLLETLDHPVVEGGPGGRT